MLSLCLRETCEVEDAWVRDVDFEVGGKVGAAVSWSENDERLEIER